MKFRWIEPLYGFEPGIDHIAVPASAEGVLHEMADELVGTDDLIAIYIPEGTENVYGAGAMKGRVVGAVRLLEMPEAGKVSDYFYADWDGTLRWPVGWPCEAVYAPPVAECPILRTQVEYVLNQSAFQPYVARFQHGPFRLERKMAERLDTLFAEFPALV